MKKHLLKREILCLLLFMGLSGQVVAKDNATNTDEKINKSYQLYGFIRTDFFAQSRNTKTSVLDLFPLYAMPQELNADGEDLNNRASAGLYSVTTRIGSHFYAPGIWGAKKTYGRIETDLSGGTDFVFLRLRQAYVQLNWEHTDLIVGQTWHPLFTLSVMPNVMSINTGAPYQPFNRSPQIRYTYSSEYWKILGAVSYQTMYKTVGKDGPSIQYQKDAIIPNVSVGAEYRREHFLGGIVGDYKAILPERYIFDSDSVKHLNNNLLHSFSGAAYLAYQKGLFKTTAKAVYGQNLSDHSIIGGFAIGPNHEYVAYNSFSSFMTLSYGKLHLLDFFVGYSENLGASKSIDNSYHFYGFGVIDQNVIGNMYRTSLMYTYNPKDWRIGLEVEYNNVGWGNIQQGKVDNITRTDVVRLNAVMMYLF